VIFIVIRKLKIVYDVGSHKSSVFSNVIFTNDKRCDILV